MMSVTECIFRERKKVVDENMLKYNKDDANYANSKPGVCEVGIM